MQWMWNATWIILRPFVSIKNTLVDWRGYYNCYIQPPTLSSNDVIPKKKTNYWKFYDFDEKFSNEWNVEMSKKDNIHKLYIIYDTTRKYVILTKINWTTSMKIVRKIINYVGEKKSVKQHMRPGLL